MKPAEFRDLMRPIVARVHRMADPSRIEVMLNTIERKVSACVSNSNIRAKRYGCTDRITANDVREVFVRDYGAECWITGETIRAANLQLDHHWPMSANKDANRPGNLTLMSARGNRIKDELGPVEAEALVGFLRGLSTEGRANIERRLATKPVWRGK